MRDRIQFIDRSTSYAHARETRLPRYSFSPLLRLPLPVPTLRRNPCSVAVRPLLVPRAVVQEEVQSEAQERKLVLFELLGVRRAERVGGGHAGDDGELAVGRLGTRAEARWETGGARGEKDEGNKRGREAR